MKHKLALVLAVLAVLAGPPVRAAAETAPAATNAALDTVIQSISVNATPLRDVARLLTAESGVPIICTPEAAKTEITLYLQAVPLRDVLHLLCRSHALWLNVGQGGTATLSTLEEFTRSFSFYEEEQVEAVTVNYPSVLDVGDALKALFRDRLVWERPEEEFGDPQEALERALERMDLLAERSQFGLDDLNTGRSSSSRNRSSSSRNRSSGSRGRGRFQGDEAYQQSDRLDREQDLLRREAEERILLDDTAAAAPELLRRRREHEPALVFLSALPEVNVLLIRSTDRTAVGQVKAAVAGMDKPRSQVLLKISILTVLHSDGRDLGFNFLVGGTRDSAGFTSGQILPPSATLYPQGTGFDQNAFVFNHVAGSFRARLEALAKKENVRELASPSLLVADNEFSTVFVGRQGQFLDQIVPGESTVSDSGIVTTEKTATLVERNIGLSLVISPRVHADRSITLRIMQERSTTDDENKRTIHYGGTAPIEVQDIDQQTVSSTLVAKDGSLVVLGGLVKDKRTKTVEGVPWLMDIPWLGRLFRREGDAVAREELIVLIAPTVMLSPGEEHGASRTLLEDLGVRMSAEPAPDETKGNPNP
jgi:type II secretory pathway component GspD/PulD (secretin)